MNHYELIDTIGEGTYGIVYKCRDKRTGRIVAVKQFKNFQTNEYIRCTMLRELRVEQLLKGEPNVTQLLETFKQRNTLYLVMEYIPRSLLDVLEEFRSGVPEGPLMVLLYTLLLGIQSCHRNGIIHRDVKPENILVRDDGTASLCDFGFCRPALHPVLTNDAGSPRSDGKHGDRLSSSKSGSGAPSSLSALHARTVSTTEPSSHPSTHSTAATAFLNELVLADHRGVMTDYVATRWYRSPEMLLGMPNYGYGVDMWAVGAIMAEIIDGEPLLPGKTELEQIALIQSRVGEFPAAYEAAVRRRNGGLLQLRSANPLAKQQGTSRGRVRLGSSSGGDGASSASSMSDDRDTISSYLSMRYGGRIRKSGMQLLARLLCVDEEGRLTVEEALAHPYFDVVRGDPRFAAPAGTSPIAAPPVDVAESPTAHKSELSRENTAAFTRLAATSVSTDALPGLSPTLRTSTGSLQPLFMAGGRGSFLTAAEQSTGRPPRASNADPLAESGAPEPSALLSRAASISTWQFGDGGSGGSHGLVTLPPLDTDDDAAGTRLTQQAVRLHDGDDTDSGGDDGNSPPPRPVAHETSAKDTAATPQRRHAASEGASATAPATSKLSITDPSSSGAEAHVSTLLFKKKSRLPADGGGLHWRSAQSEESPLGNGVATPHAAYSSAATAGALAPLRTHRSDGDGDRPLPPPGSRHPSPPLPAPAASPSKRAVAGQAAAHGGGGGEAVAQSAQLSFEKIRAAHGDDGEEEAAGIFASAPRSGGDRELGGAGAAGSGSRYQRTNSYTEQQTQRHTAALPVRKSTVRGRRPVVGPSRRSTTPQESITRRSTTSTTATAANMAAASGTTARTATEPSEAVTERRSTKTRGASPPRRNTSQTSTPVGVMTPVSARQPARRAALRKNAGGGTTITTAAAQAGAVHGGTGKQVSAADTSRFASPKLPRVVKPLQPRERITLLKEIESLGCPVETPTAVEVMLPTQASPTETAALRETAKGAEEGVDSPRSSSSNSHTRSASADSAADKEDEGSGAVRRSLLTEDSGDLYVESVDGGAGAEGGCGGDSVSRSPLLSETSEWDGVRRSPSINAVDDEDEEEEEQIDHHHHPHPYGGEPVAAADANAPSHSRPPRMDFGYPLTTAGTTSGDNSNSSRAPPSLFFRPSRPSNAPLKLGSAAGAGYGGQSTTPISTTLPLPVTSVFSGASVSMDAPSSSSGFYGGASTNVTLQLPSTPSVSGAPGGPPPGQRPTPALLRHPLANCSTAEPSPSFTPLDVHAATTEGRRASLQMVMNGGGGPHSTPARTPYDSPRIPVTTAMPHHRINVSHLSAGTPRAPTDDAGPPPAEPRGAAPAPPPQRRLSTTHLSLSVSGEFAHGGFAAAGGGGGAGGGGAGALALSRRSQERLPHLVATSPSPPPVSVDDVETEVLVSTPLDTGLSPRPQQPHPPQSPPTPQTLSPPRSDNTTVRSSNATREASPVMSTPVHGTTRDITATPLRGGSGTRAASFADLTRLRTPTLRATPLTRSQKQGSTTSSSRERPLMAEAVTVADEDELLGGAQTVSFPLPSSGDRNEPAGEAMPAVREGQGAGHTPHPVLGGVWVNVDPQRNGQGIHAGLTRKKGRLIL